MQVSSITQYQLQILLNQGPPSNLETYTNEHVYPQPL